MMDRHKRRDPVAPLVFVRDEPDALKTKVDDDRSVGPPAIGTAPGVSWT
jgi:hypothetical protein